MKGRQLERLLMHLTMGKVLREHVAILNMVPGMMRIVQTYDNLIGQLLQYADEQAKPLKQYAADKNEMRERLVRHACYLNNLAYCYGADINCEVTKVKFSQSYSALRKTWANTTLAYCKNIYAELVERQEKLKDFGIKKKDIEQLKVLIETLEKNVAMPRVMLSGKKIATKNLGEGLEEAGILLKQRLDKMIVCYAAFPAFTKAYAKARVQLKYKNAKIPLQRKIKAFKEAPKVPVQRGRKRQVAAEKELVPVD